MQNFTSLLAALVGASLLVPLTASATVRDSSTRYRPWNLGLADINGDGVLDWIGQDDQQDYDVDLYAGSGIDITYILSGWVGRDHIMKPLYTITGHFWNTARLDTCGVSQTSLVWPNKLVNCFEVYRGALYHFGSAHGATGNEIINDLPFRPDATSELRGYTVGDFDGDGYDEILTYNRFNGTEVRLYRYDRPAGRFTLNTSFALGDLAAFNVPGGVEMLAANFHDPDGARRDDLVVYSRSTRVLWGYRSLLVSGQKTFGANWQAALTFGSQHQLIVANVNGDAHDDLVVVDTTTGVTQFRWLYKRPSCIPLPNATWCIQPMQTIQGVNQGNLPLTSGVRQIWGTESHGGRDTAFAVIGDVVYRYYPAVDGNNQQTFWFSNWYALWYIWSRINP